MPPEGAYHLVRKPGLHGDRRSFDPRTGIGGFRSNKEATVATNRTMGQRFFDTSGLVGKYLKFWVAAPAEIGWHAAGGSCVSDIGFEERGI